MAPVINPNLLRETVKKVTEQTHQMLSLIQFLTTLIYSHNLIFPLCLPLQVDRCMARLQELQYTVSGGTKVISGVSLSPRSTRGYIRTSLRCKQESLRYGRQTSVSSLFWFLGLDPEMSSVHLIFSVIKSRSFQDFSDYVTHISKWIFTLFPFRNFFSK